MNSHVGESSRIDLSAVRFYKPEDFSRPGPAATFVFLDEHGDSINDGLFLVIYRADWTFGWNDVPASRHSRGANFVFADGHAERHRWKDKRTIQPITRNRLFGPNQPNNPDVLWIVDHASAPK
jgi:prepilin-type processing-associated H-X9-DG protein